jgi:hypothetical protein
MIFLKQLQGHVLSVAFVLAAAPIDGCKSWKRTRLRRRLRSQLLCRYLIQCPRVTSITCGIGSRQRGDHGILKKSGKSLGLLRLNLRSRSARHAQILRVLDRSRQFFLCVFKRPGNGRV